MCSILSHIEQIVKFLEGRHPTKQGDQHGFLFGRPAVKQFGQEFPPDPLELVSWDLVYEQANPRHDVALTHGLGLVFERRKVDGDARCGCRFRPSGGLYWPRRRTARPSGGAVCGAAPSLPSPTLPCSVHEFSNSCMVIEDKQAGVTHQ